MPLIRLDKISVNFGTQIILDEVNLTIKKGQKFGLLGRNGTGKSTLMKLISGDIMPDDGERWLKPGTKISWLEQTLPIGSELTVYDVVAGGLEKTGELLKDYHRVIANYGNENIREIETIQNQIEAVNGWIIGQKIDTIITQLQLPADKLMTSLSGGWKKRVALAKALVIEPDLLLLDEPTNHLDIPTIEWLEKFLQDYNGAILLVSHDRSFLQNVSNSITELDRGNLYQFNGSFEKFLIFREQQLAAEETTDKLFDKKLEEEEVWIRRGIKARRTRNEGRVRALESLRRERSERRERNGNANFELQSTSSSGKIVAELTGVSHNFDNNTIIDDFSTTIIKGDKIGLLGSNGVGKSTLLKIILGDLEPSKGSVKLGTKLEIAYFDQLRSELDLERNLIDNICDGKEYIEINGKIKHAISYLGEFLFTPDRVRTPAKALSGGEQNRAILAKVFSKPANVLVLDEPTNDLDIETLELLEELLMKFNGTILLVSHDRKFMDNVVTSTMAFSESGLVTECVGGYSDWVKKRGSTIGLEKVLKKKKQDSNNNKSINSKNNPDENIESKKDKISYKEQRELNSLPSAIEKLEKKKKKLEELISSPNFYSEENLTINETLKDLSDLQTTLDIAFERWEELEDMK
jgi:ABC transport system ATP-binding/permease protein